MLKKKNKHFADAKLPKNFVFCRYEKVIYVKEKNNCMS